MKNIYILGLKLVGSYNVGKRNNVIAINRHQFLRDILQHKTTTHTSW